MTGSDTAAHDDVKQGRRRARPQGGNLRSIEAQIAEGYIDRRLEHALEAAMPDVAAVMRVMSGINLDVRDIDRLRVVINTLREVRVRAQLMDREGSWEARVEVDRQVSRFLWQTVQYWKPRPKPRNAAYSESYLVELDRLYGWLSETALENLLARPRGVSLGYLRHLVNERRLGRLALEDLEGGT